MRIIPVIDAKAHLSSYLDQCHCESIVITRNGRARASLIPAPEDQDELDRLMLAYSPKLWRLMEQAAARIQQTGGHSARQVLGDGRAAPSIAEVSQAKADAVNRPAWKGSQRCSSASSRTGLRQNGQPQHFEPHET